MQAETIKNTIEIMSSIEDVKIIDLPKFLDACVTLPFDVKPGLWRDLDNFSSGAVCLVLASEVYQREDYIRDYQEFLEFREGE